MKHDYKVGDIIFYKTDTLFGKLISKITGHKHSHVAVMVANGLVIESVAFKKTRLVHLARTEFKSIKVMRALEPLTEDQLKCINKSMTDLVGLPYDYLGVFRMLTKLIFRRNLDKIPSDLNRVWCSELVDYMYSRCGIKLVEGTNNHHVDIEDLEKSPLLYEVMTVSLK